MIVNGHEVALWKAVPSTGPGEAQGGKKRPFDLLVSSDGGKTWALVLTKSTRVTQTVDDPHIKCAAIELPLKQGHYRGVPGSGHRGERSRWLMDIQDGVKV
jgi:hypothetical protein